MKIAVVDDERPARSELIFLLSSLVEEGDFFEADSAKAACELMKEHTFAVWFLDVGLGDIRGTVLASMIREKQPKAGIVFVTAYQDYAVEAFDLDAVDYILKPYDLKRVEKSLEKLRNQGYMNKEASFLGADKIAVNGGDRILLIDMQDIIFIESSTRGCYIRTKDRCYEENTTLNHMVEKLKGKSFYRVHKSYVVNLSFVEELLPGYSNGYAMRMRYYREQPIPISRSQVKNIRSLYLQ